MDGPLLADQRLIIKMNFGGPGVLGGTPVPRFQPRFLKSGRRCLLMVADRSRLPPPNIGSILSTTSIEPHFVCTNFVQPKILDRNSISQIWRRDAFCLHLSRA